jgi:hypothetical protein
MIVQHTREGFLPPRRQEAKSAKSAKMLHVSRIDAGDTEKNYISISRLSATLSHEYIQPQMTQKRTWVHRFHRFTQIVKAG